MSATEPELGEVSKGDELTVSYTNGRRSVEVLKIRAGKAVVWTCWGISAVIFLFFLARLTLHNV